MFYKVHTNIIRLNDFHLKRGRNHDDNSNLCINVDVRMY